MKTEDSAECHQTKIILYSPPAGQSGNETNLLYAFKGWGRGRALYRDASPAAHVLGLPPSRGGDLELEGGVNVSL